MILGVRRRAVTLWRFRGSADHDDDDHKPSLTVLPVDQIKISLLSIISLLWFIVSIMLPAAVPARRHTTRPMVTGTSVIGVVYNGGVLMAADTLLSYGSLAKAQRVPRLTAIPNTHAVVGGSGEYSDYAKLVEILTAKALEESTTSLMSDLYSPSSFSAQSIWNYLRMLMYRRRNRMNPYWNDLIVAGYDAARLQPFLGSVDKIGTTVSDQFLATGFGAYLAVPLLREKYRPDLTEGEARAILEDCMRVLFYRDCRASSTIQLAKCDASGVLVSEPYELETSWDSPDFVRPVADLDGDGGW